MKTKKVWKNFSILIMKKNRHIFVKCTMPAGSCAAYPGLISTPLKPARRKMSSISSTITRRPTWIKRNTCKCLKTAVGNIYRITHNTVISENQRPPCRERKKSFATMIPERKCCCAYSNTGICRLQHLCC